MIAFRPVARSVRLREQRGYVISVVT